MSSRDEEAGKLSRFVPSLGNILTILGMLTAIAASWASISADMREQKTKIEQLEKDETARKEVYKELKGDLKGEIKEVKQDVRELNRKLDMIIENQQRRESRERR